MQNSYSNKISTSCNNNMEENKILKGVMGSEEKELQIYNSQDNNSSKKSEQLSQENIILMEKIIEMEKENKKLKELNQFLKEKENIHLNNSPEINLNIRKEKKEDGFEVEGFNVKKSDINAKKDKVE